VRFVDRKERDRCLVQQFEAARVVRRSGATYSRSSSPGEEIPLDCAGRGCVQARVQELRTDAELGQRGHLVLHQRDQWRDDDRRARAQQRRELVAQRLAAAGRHQHQRVARPRRRAATISCARVELLVARRRRSSSSGVGLRFGKPGIIGDIHLFRASEEVNVP